MTHRVEREINGRVLSIETGRVAKQAKGAVWVQYADTVVLATVLSSPPTRDIDFFPLYVDYREAQYSAGKIPGGFFKREGRPSTKEILTCRMVDRPIRPLFPKDFMNEVQIQCMVLSTDNQNDPDLLAIIGSSAALAVSGIPWDGPIGAAKVGYADGRYIVNPTYDDLEESQMLLLVAGPEPHPNMIELEGKEVSEDVVAGGVDKAIETCRVVIEMIRELAEQVRPEPLEYEPRTVPEELKAAIEAKYGQRIRDAKQIQGKQERNTALQAVRDEALAEFCPPDAEEEPPYTAWQVKEALFRTEGKIQRQLILSGRRPDGRDFEEIRPLDVRVGVLPRTHGSAIFSRGETQALATATLGTPRDEQIIDGLLDEYKKKFMLHYNFPPFCVGEIRPIRGPGRREIGHGALAEKSIEPVMPKTDEFPYTVRIVADMLESNGSTSMATVCGGSLALMDAGVPITAPVAGISIGMVSDEQDPDRYVLLTDIMGEEDFHGDMDFKVAGTRTGITGIQLDMKARGIPPDRIRKTLEQARRARLKILDVMTSVIPEPRPELNRYAPRLLVVKIDTDKIGKVIGPGGKTINRIQEETGATIDVEDDGTIYIGCTDAAGAEAAKAQIEGLTAEAVVGRIYKGKVVSVTDFGAFIEILPGQDGLCHVSELSNEYVRKVTDVVNLGDVVDVKVINIDDQGRIKLSRKALLAEEDGDGGESGGTTRPGGGAGGTARPGGDSSDHHRKRRRRRSKPRDHS
ncbi:MAG: polyribonucleotide nucleotidyltransferase [Planctomycetes bacterium]|nr:polyribonucleotide nucleotidyltransferase [Planctomycetota bacterium]